MKESLKVNEFGEFEQCLCGNTAQHDGFFPSDGQGNEVEPTPTSWTTDAWLCARCGRLIKSNGEVVGQREGNWEKRVQWYEEQGLTRSDAQDQADADWKQYGFERVA